MIAMETWRSYATICRLCLQKDGFMLGIFNHIQGKDKSIYKKIIDCTALQISHGDGLPNVICHRCLFKIEFCLEFRQLCFMSDATLRQLAGVANKENGTDTTNNNNTQLPLYEQLETAGNDENVIMVVDPLTYDYESDYESEKEPPTSDNDNNNPESNNDMLETESKGVTMCKYCDHAFTDTNECVNHELTAHNIDSPYTCNTCNMSFGDRALYSAHLKSVHKNDKPYNCPQCSRTFARRSDLRKHTIVHTGVKPYTCSVCFKSFSRNTNLSKHMRIHSGTKPFVCPKCPKTFTSKADLSRHAIIHSGQRPFCCNYCHLSFGRKDKLQRHEKIHFPQENSEDRSKELQMMRENLSIYSNVDEIKDVVGEEEEEDLRREGSENMVIQLDPFSHNNYPTTEAATPQRGDNNSENEPHSDHNHASMTGQTTIEEDEDDAKDSKSASQTSTTGEALNDGKSGGGGKPFRRSKRFSKDENALLRPQSHSSGGGRPFSCHICSKTFIRKRELDRHIATHSGMKPFKCPRCSKSFGRKDKMIRHMRIHDISKHFSCNVCGSSFNRRDGLQQHLKTHSTTNKETEDENNLA